MRRERARSFFRFKVSAGSSLAGVESFVVDVGFNAVSEGGLDDYVRRGSQQAMAFE